MPVTHSFGETGNEGVVVGVRRIVDVVAHHAKGIRIRQSRLGVQNARVRSKDDGVPVNQGRQFVRGTPYVTHFRHGVFPQLLLEAQVVLVDVGSAQVGIDGDPSGAKLVVKRHRGGGRR